MTNNILEADSLLRQSRQKANTLDIAVMADPASTTLQKTVASFSLLLSVVTFGTSPNFGGAVRGAGALHDAAKVEGVAADLAHVRHAATDAAKASEAKAVLSNSFDAETIYRRGTSYESARRLSIKAQEAEEKIGIHGVSASSVQEINTSSAPRAKIEEIFPVHNTPTKADPNHKTIELPKPVTNEVARLFNLIFARKKR